MIIDSHAHYAHASFSGSFRYLSWEENWTMREGTLEDLFGQMQERGIAMSVEPGIGLARLKALHINDSKNPFASHKDRHECIGSGSLGVATFERIVHHPLLAGKPMSLETPNELPGYQAEIALLRSKI